MCLIGHSKLTRAGFFNPLLCQIWTIKETVNCFECKHLPNEWTFVFSKLCDSSQKSVWRGTPIWRHECRDGWGHRWSCSDSGYNNTFHLPLADQETKRETGSSRQGCHSTRKAPKCGKSSFTLSDILNSKGTLSWRSFTAWSKMKRLP